MTVKGTVTFVRWSKTGATDQQYKLKSLDSLTSITILRERRKQAGDKFPRKESVQLQVDETLSLDEAEAFRKDNRDIKVRTVNS